MKRTLSVGLELPGAVAEYVPFRSDKSLFDADVVLFWPTFADYSSTGTYAGRPSIDESDSADLVRDCGHWRTELENAVDSGKAVFVFLNKPVEVYYDTGRREYSGTGRNRQTTRIVDRRTSFDALPFTLRGLMPRGGTAIATFAALVPLSDYWRQFGPHSAYEVYFEAGDLTPILGTKSREKVVGAILRPTAGGAFVLLPPVNWDDESFTYTRGKSSYWSSRGIAFGRRFVGALVEAATAVRSVTDRSPMPDWAKSAHYDSDSERALRRKLADLDRKIEALSSDKRDVLDQLDAASVLRTLLFESGHALERAVTTALQHLGFQIQPFNSGGSEFDAIFSSPEGRCLGEVEGKETKAVNIDKISQLARNIEEDFARDEITAYANPVLFANAFRFQPPSKRKEYFTEKCRAAAARMGAALVRTPDLLAPATYLEAHPDPAYALACRSAIFAAAGLTVVFPSPPPELAVEPEDTTGREA